MSRVLGDAIGASLMFAAVGCVALPHRDMQPFVAAAGRYSLMASGSAAPQGGQCQNCRGEGRIGDGRVFVTCPECNGTGKTPKSVCVSGCEKKP